ncbi:MAG: hypothetical protein KIS61_19195 [Candidatus Eremiobacteraeota bacterium]|nr:hypothetical protein [Candidatus Eremiobacteraeota bacterium]
MKKKALCIHVVLNEWRFRRAVDLHIAPGQLDYEGKSDEAARRCPSPESLAIVYHQRGFCLARWASWRRLPPTLTNLLALTS